MLKRKSVEVEMSIIDENAYKEYVNVIVSTEKSLFSGSVPETM